MWRRHYTYVLDIAEYIKHTSGFETKFPVSNLAHHHLSILTLILIVKDITKYIFTDLLLLALS